LAKPLRDVRQALAVARVGLAYWWRHGRWPSLADPRTFTEWVQWRKLNDRDPARSMLTDKAFSKRLAARLLGEEFVVPTLWEGEVLPEVAPWPVPFVVKANHGCGQWRVVRDPADYRRVRHQSPRWLARHYGAWLDEWHYRAARRTILVEAYVGSGPTLPVDYKVYVFGGRAVMVQVHEGRGGNHFWRQFDRDWQPLSHHAGTAAPPASLAIMLAAAETLAGEADFLRVDFYEVDGRPLFGEFCLYPGSGLDPFNPVELDQWLGGYWSATGEGRRLAPSWSEGIAAPEFAAASIAAE
jgi:hypothetical protein